MAMPGFTAQESLSKTNTHYRSIASLAASISVRVFPTGGIKGTHCIVQDPNCPSGFSKMFCRNFNPDDCVETGICCTPTGGGGGGGGGGPVNCGDHFCASGDVCCGPSCCSAGDQCCDAQGHCCAAGTHCCSDGDGCCPNGSTCRSIFGWHFCSPI